MTQETTPDAAAPANPAQTPPRSLRQRAMTGSAWWTACFVAMKGLQLVSNIVLAWLLTPAAFGIVALADVVIRGLNTVTQVGIRPAMVQSERDDQDFIDTAWTIQVIRGGLIFLFACALAWPAAWFYETPMLLGLIPVVGITMVVESLSSTHFFRLNRKLDEAPRAILRLNEQLIARFSMIGIALVWATPWALVLGNLMGNLYFMVRSHFMTDAPWHRFRTEPDAMHSLIRFGRWVLVGSLIVFVAREADKLLLGKLVNDHMSTLGLFGVYVLAQRLAAMPAEGIQALAGQVALPVLAETARDAPQQFTPRLLRVRRVVLLPAMASSLAILWFSPVFFDWFYDDRYAAATWMTPLISLTIWLTLMNGLVNRALLALGEVRTLAWTGGVNAVGSIAGALAGFHLAGIPGFILGVALGNAAQHCCELIMLAKAGVSVWRQDIGYCLVFAVLATAGAAPRWVPLPGLSEMATTGLAIGVPAIMLAILGSIAMKAAWREVRPR